MKEINPNQVNFNAINLPKGMKASAEGVKNMKEIIETMVKELSEKAKDSRAVPPYGEFSPVFVKYENSSSNMNSNGIVLKICKPPKNVQGHETIRNLEVSVYQLPLPYKSECIVSTGSSQDIINALENPETIEKINKAIDDLSK